MKTTLAIFLISFLLFGMNGLVKGQNLTGKQKLTIEKQVDSVFHAMVKAAENLDYDKISTGVDDRCNAGFIVNGAYYTRYDSLIYNFKANLRNGAKQSITLQNKKITVLSDCIVLLTATGDAGLEFNTGQILNVRFFWSFVYEKINNDWKVIQSHQSSSR